MMRMLRTYQLMFNEKPKPLHRRHGKHPIQFTNHREPRKLRLNHQHQFHNPYQVSSLLENPSLNLSFKHHQHPFTLLFVHVLHSISPPAAQSKNKPMHLPSGSMVCSHLKNFYAIPQEQINRLPQKDRLKH